MKKHYLPLLFLFSILTSFNTFAQINAVDDNFEVVYGATNVVAGNFLLNDTLNGNQALASNVSITTVSSSNPGVTISGTNINVAAGTPQGSYVLVYQICIIGNPTSCDTGVVTINTELITYPDSFTTSNCQYYVGNILGTNGNPLFIDTLNGVPAILQTYYTNPGNIIHPANVVVTLINTYPGINLNPNGDIFILPGVLAPGNYPLTYQLCEIANPNNCDVSFATIGIVPGFLYAAPDDFSFSPIDNTVGGATMSVLNNDFSECNGMLNQFNSFVYPQSIPNGLTLQSDGVITVPVGTPPGTYIIQYGVCETTPFGTCSSATAIVVVTGISSLVANYDYLDVNYPNATTTLSVLTNDTLNGSPLNSNDIIITPLNIPAGFSINANGTIAIGNVSEGTYPVPYQICRATNLSDCTVNYAYVVVFKNRILGKVKFDANANGCDASDPFLNNISIKNNNNSNAYTSYTNYNGASDYYLIGDVGTNTVSVTNLPSYFTVTPATQVFNFTLPGTTIAPDFCITANTNVDDLEIVLIPRFNVVPGLPAYYDILYKNNGSTTLSGQVTFQFDNTKMTFSSSTPSPNNIGLNTITYNFASLAPFEKRKIYNVKLLVATPPTVDSGNVVSFSGNITPLVADATPIDNSSAVNQTVVNAQDPNDIIVHEGATITLAQAQQGYLHYTIRFQNVGTSDAINIKVLNDLDPKLDWSTFQLITSSHNCRVKNKNGHNEFLFEGIYLPGTTNEPLSHGYVTYKVKPIASIAVGNVIPNAASIYFDYNAPITTNTASTTVVSNLSIENFAFSNFNYYPNPVKNSLTISNSSVIDAIELTSILGQNILSKKINDLQTELNISSLSKGIYFVKVSSQGQEKIVKIIKE
ncbi:T9SS type A sorting domain-containing protein [Flavobacterium sp.]|uniref:T9SS type A sorting domain-containing protein n=1 Tax=Flavobacterium sp. TaxID=239 RepID=UPI00375029A6